MLESLTFYPQNKDLAVWIDIRKKILALYAFMAGTLNYQISKDRLIVYRPMDFTNNDYDLLKVRLFPAVEKLAIHFDTIINHIECPDLEKELLINEI